VVIQPNKFGSTLPPAFFGALLLELFWLVLSCRPVPGSLGIAQMVEGKELSGITHDTWDPSGASVSQALTS